MSDLPEIFTPSLMTKEQFPNITGLELLQYKANIAMGRIPRPEGWVDDPEIDLPIRVNPNNIVTDE